MSQLIRIATVVLVLAGIASAGTPTTRVVLVDPDPELLLAVKAALAPWRLELIVDATPIDAEHASARADAQSARFVVWREAGELVVFDRERNEAEHRTASAGELDPVAAAAAALTVKTLMRLPPPEGDVVTPPPPPPAGGPEVRVQAGLHTRFAARADTGARFVGAAMLRPFAARGWRFGFAGEAGSNTTVENAGFKGTWSDWAVLAVASWTHTRGSIELEPYVAAGVTRSKLSGVEMNQPREETAVLAALRAGLWVRWRYGMWSVGAVAGFDAVPGTPTYTKRNNNSSIYEVPSFGAVVGIVLAADLGR